jgi:hypothetical protein
VQESIANHSGPFSEVKVFDSLRMTCVPWFPLFFVFFIIISLTHQKMLSLLSKNVFGRFMTQTATPMMTIRGVASKPNKTAKLKAALKVEFIDIKTTFDLR